jgi:hypothetical protein
MDNRKDRRGFFKKALFAAGTITTGKISIEASKIKLLTAEGELVEIDQAVLDSSSKKKVSHEEILSWSKKKEL